ncbi:MAG: glucokinase [Proteobacteria bacterium]|nr:glucokinase [Burkholderiales bacterium]
MSERLILAADVGASKTRVLAESVAAHTVVHEVEYENANHVSVAEILAEFVTASPIRAVGGEFVTASLAVAGPTDGLFCRMTNRAWDIEARDLSMRLAIPTVRLVNDVQAAAYGVGQLAPADMVRLQAGSAVAGAPRVVLAPGSGLGIGYAVSQPAGYLAYPSEAGHADFAPCDELQVELLTHLRGRFGHVSWERVLSGPGLASIFEFLIIRKHATVTSDLVQDVERRGGLAVTEAALKGGHTLARTAMSIFITAYGALAGSLALTFMPRGGIYLGGGITPQIIDAMRDGQFMQAFAAKGRFADQVAQIPVYIVLGRNPNLLGAAMIARHFAS